MAWGRTDSALSVAGYRLPRKPSTAPRNRALGLQVLKVGLIGGWSGVFFGRRGLSASTALAAALWRQSAQLNPGQALTFMSHGDAPNHGRFYGE